MGDTRRPGGGSIDSEADKDAAESPDNNPGCPDESLPGVGRSSNRRDAELESCDASIRPEFGFAPAIELSGKRGGNSTEPPGGSGFGFASEIELLTKRDTPPARRTFSRGDHLAQSAAPVLPYEATKLDEAAELAASASLLQQSRLNGKFASVCLAVIIATVSVASGAAIWSTHDDGDVSPASDISAARSDASETNLFNRNIQRAVHAPKLDNLVAASQTVAPTVQIDRSPTTGEDRVPPRSSMAYPSTSINNSAALASVETDEADGLRDQAKGNVSPKPSAIAVPPSTLAASASSRSTIDRQALTTTNRDRLDNLDTSPNRKPDDQPTLRGDYAAPRTILPPRPELKPLKIAVTVSATHASQQLKLPPTPKMKPLKVAATIGSSKEIGEMIFRPALKPKIVASVTTTSVAVGQAERPPVLIRIWRTLFGSSADTERNGDETGRVLLAANDRSDNDNRGSVDRRSENDHSKSDIGRGGNTSDNDNGGSRNDDTGKGGLSSGGNQAGDSDKGGGKGDKGGGDSDKGGKSDKGGGKSDKGGGKSDKGGNGKG